MYKAVHTLDLRLLALCLLLSASRVSKQNNWISFSLSSFPNPHTSPPRSPNLLITSLNKPSLWSSWSYSIPLPTPPLHPFHPSLPSLYLSLPSLYLSLPSLYLSLPLSTSLYLLSTSLYFLSTSLYLLSTSLYLLSTSLCLSLPPLYL